MYAKKPLFLAASFCQTRNLVSTKFIQISVKLAALENQEIVLDHKNAFCSRQNNIFVLSLKLISRSVSFED